jgi:hypothetical protein
MNNCQEFSPPGSKNHENNSQKRLDLFDGVEPSSLITRKMIFGHNTGDVARQRALFSMSFPRAYEYGGF